MTGLKIVNIVGCRPNFIKIAPLVAEMKKHLDISPLLVHTGQHYDRCLSEIFFEDLQISRPDISLKVQSGSHARQTAEIMVALEEVFEQHAPDLVLVVGDVNSTLAASLTAVKLGIPVAHVEAGLRSFDREMPEEINRVLTDALSDFLFASEQSGVDNLIREGRPAEKIFFVGNILIDTLHRSLERIEDSPILENLHLRPKSYAVLTLHRPGNVDQEGHLQRILEALAVLPQHIPIVFPVHPRTADRLRQLHIHCSLPSANLRPIDPLGYVDFLKLLKDSRLVLTDSGGVQEESTVLQVPCLTLRENTERPVTISEGTNRLVGSDPDRITAEVNQVLNENSRPARLPERWDGRSAKRIVEVLLKEKQVIKELYSDLKEITLCRKVPQLLV